MAAQDIKTGPIPASSQGASLSGSKADSQTMLSAEERNQMIAVAAYYKAEQRGFASGDELGDWLAAEKESKLLLEGIPPGPAVAAMPPPTGADTRIPASPATAEAAKPKSRVRL